MRRFCASLVASACLVALFGAGSPAHAAFATFVSGSGSDGADCLTPATACRQLFGATAALSKTDEGGIIHVLPGEYIAFTVNKGLEIVADGGQASVFSTVASDAGIFVDVPGDKVVRIRGFLVNAAHGIRINGAGVVHIEDCTLLGVETKYGLLYQPTGAGELYVSGTRLSRPTVPSNAGGMLIKPTGSGSATVVLDNVEVADNGHGINIEGTATSGAINVLVRNSVMSGNVAFGIKAIETGTGSINVTLESSTSSSNGTNGVIAVGSNAIIRMRNSTSTRNAAGLVVSAGGQIITHGGNVVAGNTTNGVFTDSFAQQ